ncbi:MAG: DUF1707 domain-containing protein, partial [Geodermatophilaceae bacterium]|nr:DUF1707 domain-containing protein [Geodermatophilaceae bacterium]
MDERRDVRVSDRERQVAADRLRAALDEGRLDLYEYDHRLTLAYRSLTYRDLDPLFADLPLVASPAPSEPAHRAAPSPSSGTGMPTALKVLWTVWAAVMAVNLTVWLLASLGNGGADYFWPAWLLVPGAALFG